MGLLDRLLGKTEPEKPVHTQEEQKEIINDLTNEMAKYIVVGNNPREQLVPLEETEAFKRFEKSGIKIQSPPPKDPGPFLDYDKIIDDIIAGLPKEMAPILTAIGNVDPVCPYCKAIFQKKPKAKTKCKSCGNFVYVRTRPLDNEKVLVTDEQTGIIDLQNTVKDGIYASMKGSLKENLKNYQARGYDCWQFLGVCDERSPVEEINFHKKVIKRGSPEEISALKIMCRIDCRARPIAWFENFHKD